MASRKAETGAIVEEGAPSLCSPGRPRVTIASIMGLVALVAACCTWPLLIIPVAPVVFVFVLRYFFPTTTIERLVVASIVAVFLGLLIPGMQRSHCRPQRSRPVAPPTSLPARPAVWSTDLESSARVR
jgi:hypothetical protein